MSRGLLTALEIPTTGVCLDTTYTAATATDGDSVAIDKDERVIVFVKNEAVAPINVTFSTPGTVNGVAITEHVVAVANGTTKVFSNFDVPTFQQSNGTLYIDYSSATTISVAAFKLKK